MRAAEASKILISIHALREEGDRPTGKSGRRCQISIHALREEGDRGQGGHQGDRERFLSTPSARRATRKCLPREKAVIRFLSTPSARRATVTTGVNYNAQVISIHALREEGDWILPTWAWAL